VTPVDAEREVKELLGQASFEELGPNFNKRSAHSNQSQF